jgi:ABC-type multidrug transport system fused ATPase/permease subunit
MGKQSKTPPADVMSKVILVRSGAFGWKKDEGPILQDVNMSISRSQFTILVGPVACGKTTLLKALLGETPSSKGFVHVSTLDFSFCGQTPWLLSQSVQKNILGFASFDSEWYNAVVHACALDEDIRLFPLGDQTLIGSNGISFSGGQKQRLAIARAVYAKKEVAIFDDVFSGLDATTEHHVFDRGTWQRWSHRRARDFRRGRGHTSKAWTCNKQLKSQKKQQVSLEIYTNSVLIRHLGSMVVLPTSPDRRATLPCTSIISGPSGDLL